MNLILPPIYLATATNEEGIGVTFRKLSPSEATNYLSTVPAHHMEPCL